MEVSFFKNKQTIQVQWIILVLAQLQQLFDLKVVQRIYDLSMWSTVPTGFFLFKRHNFFYIEPLKGFLIILKQLVLNV